MLGADLPGFGMSKYYWQGRLNFDAGYFVAKNWAVGSGIGLQYTALKNGGEQYNYLTLQPSVFTRYYLPIPSKRLQFFTHAEAGLNWRRTETPDFQKDLSHFFKVGGGAEYFLSPRFSIEAGAFYDGTFQRLRGNWSLDFTLRYRFGGKKKKE